MESTPKLGAYVIGHGVGILFAYYLNRYIKSANTQKIVMAIEVKII